MRDFLLSRKERIASCILAAFVLPFLLFVSTPFDVFGNNLGEAKFDLNDFIWSSLLVVFLIGLALFLIMFLIPKKASLIVRYIFIALAVLAFVQGTFLNQATSAAGDSMATENVPTVFKVLDYSFWIIVVAGFVVLACFAEKKEMIKTIMLVLPIIVLFVQAVTMVSSAVTNEDIFKPLKERTTYQVDDQPKTLTMKNANLTSNNSNVFYFIVDRFDEEYAENSYATNPEVFHNLDGFTWFQDNIALYGHTFPAMCYLITDMQYKAGDSRRETYFDKAYADATPIKTLAENGYDVNLYTEYYYSVDRNLPNYITNATESEYYVSNHIGLSFELCLWSLARCLPFGIQEGIPVSSSSFNGNTMIKGEESDIVESKADNRLFYDFLNENGFETPTDHKVFSLIHISGCHEAESDFHGNNNSVDRKNSLQNSFYVIDKYIDELKKNGTYKDATIIITGDHGAPHTDTQALSKAVLTAMLIKPSGSSDTPLAINTAQVSQSNTWPTIMKSLGITDSKYYTMDGYFDIEEGKNQKRIQIWETFCSYTDEFVYEINGQGKVFGNWKIIEENHYDKHVMN